ncbi:hypothetical protein AAFF_G00359260 [Aldrovandia affinis]|uniref:Uncharacterized protein n=1 Tax=Aldrovandia affinis TaxID=143900 RepID=A0AAD7SI01_9TELE|nr:hypothetical protein AAFF_G00359260 [Aldrovandia affinis]
MRNKPGWPRGGPITTKGDCKTTVPSAPEITQYSLSAGCSGAWHSENEKQTDGGSACELEGSPERVGWFGCHGGLSETRRRPAGTSPREAPAEGTDPDKAAPGQGSGEGVRDLGKNPRGQDVTSAHLAPNRQAQTQTETLCIASV